MKLSLEVCMTIFAAVVVPSISWVIVKIMQYDKELVKLKAEIVGMRRHCTEKHEQDQNLWNGVRRIERNIVKIGSIMNVENLENPD